MQTNLTDHELMLLVAQRDVTAYRELVARYLNFCTRFAERMVGSRHDAEDIAQEACLKIWNEAPRWQPKAKFSTWLYRVMFNSCIDYKRKVIPLPLADESSIMDESLSADELINQEQNSKRVQQALHKLPERQRAAIVLSYYEEFNNQQAAETLDMQLNAFQQLLFRARQNLKSELFQYYVEHKNGQR